MKTNVTNVTVAMQLMIDAIKKYKLELLDSQYKNDFYVHDKNMLEKLAVPGMKFMWCIGDSHSHLLPLDVHERHDDMVSCLSNLSSNDQYFVIEFGRSGVPTLKHLSRQGFMELGKSTKYHSTNSRDNMSLSVYEGKRYLGFIALTYKGGKSPLYEVKIDQSKCLSDLDRAVLLIYAQQAPCVAHHSLFVSYTIEVMQ